jgi:threonyl-tRNA synthetase
MQILLLHTNSIEVIPKKPAFKSAPDAEKDKPINMENCVTILAASEKVDEGREEEVAQKVVEECKKYSEQVHVQKFMLYPYVHLTSDPSGVSCAKEVLDLIRRGLYKDFEVKSAPFGWYKEFKIHVKGHPLAELSRKL